LPYLEKRGIWIIYAKKSRRWLECQGSDEAYNIDDKQVFDDW
jgi:hypothetical protein